MAFTTSTADEFTPPMIPLFHDFTGKRVVIVGGGSVALRKAKRFATEAAVTVVAPEFLDAFESLSCDLLSRRVTPDDAADIVAGAFLVVTATDEKAVNDSVAGAAKQAGCLVNRADEVGEVVVPSHIESAELSLAISTDGASPTTTKYLREELDPLVAAADAMIHIQRTLREQLKTDIDEQQVRKRLLRAVVERDAIWELLPENDQQALTLARETIRERTDDAALGEL